MAAFTYYSENTLQADFSDYNGSRKKGNGSAQKNVKIFPLWLVKKLVSGLSTAPQTANLIYPLRLKIPDDTAKNIVFLYLTCSETAMLGKETTPAPPQEGC